MKSVKYIALSALAVLAMSSCDDFLDKNPDDRADLTVDADTKIPSLLVSAYPAATPILINEMLTDNVTDNGKQYSSTLIMEELYRLKDATDTGNDSPYQLWNRFYNSVAVANQALDEAEKAGNPASLKASIAEAKLIRAYSMFTLANTFCMAYNPEKADEYLGLYYPTEVVTDITVAHERGTLRELYAQIDKDIEEALPDVTDNYSAPKYHFNVKAAYAFAARFNLFYMNYQKCVTYANKVLGENPANLLRNYGAFSLLAGVDDMWNSYINSSQSTNLLILPAYSQASVYVGPYSTSRRFRHNQTMCSYETIWANAPWGQGSSNNTLYFAKMCYGTNQGVYVPTLPYMFEYTDKVSDIGYSHTVDVVFTCEETLLCRAEAKAMLHDYDGAVADMNEWVKSHCNESEGSLRRPTLTVASLNSFYEALDYAPVNPEGWRDRSIRKKFNPQGFTVEEGTQENLLQMILHMRRIDGVSHGTRFIDLKRYGISFAHALSGEDAVIFEPGDLRGAVQIPADVLSAGVAPNPRAAGGNAGSDTNTDDNNE
ncbi:MAG: RagB/SusD family nutrient uptake outer membrane protein [Clostridium sp.]|nr:RagB/SusD family nutrient uptake outer membrane protein [Clostridium sp.]